jgi:hypothetical protein
MSHPQNQTYGFEGQDTDEPARLHDLVDMIRPEKPAIDHERRP